MDKEITEFQRGNSREAALYLKQNAGFARLLTGFRDKYASLGHVGGRVILNSLRAEERQALEGLMQRSYIGQKSAVISAEKFAEALNQTRFAPCDMKLVLEYYEEKQPLVVKKEEREQAQKRQHIFWERLLEEWDGTKAGVWLRDAVGDLSGTCQIEQRRLVQDYHGRLATLAADLGRVMVALNQLPVWEGTCLRLAAFSAKVSKDPHYFDEKQWGTVYLLAGIRYLCCPELPMPVNAEGRAELLYRGGILRDDISNEVTCCGITGQYVDGRIHAGMEAFAQAYEPLVLTMNNISRLISADAISKEIYVVENPTVFADLVEGWQMAKADGIPDERQNRAAMHTQKAVICSNGQVNLAVLVLMDLLQKSGCHFYYAGDFDPEGLLIADKLCRRYGTDLTLWHYETADYQACQSEVIISEKRLKQLEKLHVPELAAIGAQLMETKRAGYQEQLLKRYLQD